MDDFANNMQQEAQSSLCNSFFDMLSCDFYMPPNFVFDMAELSDRRKHQPLFLIATNRLTHPGHHVVLILDSLGL